MGCKHCKKDLEHLPGKRKKEFCNDTCRSNFWQKERRKKNNAVKLEKEKKEPEPVVPHEKEESKEEVKEQPKPQSSPAKVSGYLAQRQQMKNGNK